MTEQEMRYPRLGVMSDLHLEGEPHFWHRMLRLSNGGRSPEAEEALALQRELHEEDLHPGRGPDLRSLKAQRIDALILAGDINTGVDAVRYAHQAGTYLGCPVILVPGNHESYGSDLEVTMAAMWAAAKEFGDVHFLERETVTLELAGVSVAFVGATLWTDYSLHGDPIHSMMVAARGLSDHALITLGNRPFMPGDALKEHDLTLEWLAKAIPAARARADEVVVVTHHAPVPEGIPRPMRGNKLSPAFASDLRHEIRFWAPDLWVFGHTHHRMTGAIGRTCLISAPRGYPHADEARGFVPSVIDLSPPTADTG